MEGSRRISHRQNQDVGIGLGGRAEMTHVSAGFIVRVDLPPRATCSPAMVTALAVACLLITSGFESAGAPPKADAARAGRRLAWTTSRVHGSPEPPLPYVTEPAFPALKFTDCLDLVAMPGSDRLFIVEQAGRIFSFPNKSGVKTADLAIDLTKAIPGVQQVYALVFHPDFAQNR